MNSKKLKFLSVHFKTLSFILFCLIFAISCNESILESEQLAETQTTTLNLKAATIGNKYYVSKSGSNSNLGTASAPYLTIQKGLDAAKAGDTVFVMAGTYMEAIYFGKSGTEGSPIVIKNYSSNVVTVDAESKRSYCFSATDRSHIVIDGINVKNGLYYNFVISGGSNIKLKNLSSILPISTSGSKINIKLAASTTNWLSNVTLDNVTTYGGAVGVGVTKKVDTVNIYNGSFSYSKLEGLNFTDVSNSDSTLFAKNILVDGAEVHHNSRQGILSWAVRGITLRNTWTHHNNATGIQIENFSSNILIEDFISENNSQDNVAETGVWIDDSHDAVIRRGIIRNNEIGVRVSNSRSVVIYDLLIYSNNSNPSGGVCNSAGISFYSLTINYPTNAFYLCNVKMYNCVVYSNGNSQSQRGTIDLEGFGNYTLKNNIFANDKSKLDIYRSGSHTLTSDYNLFYNTRALSVYYAPKGSYVYPYSYTAYKTLTSQDPHSINANPQFKDAAKGDFTLLSTSPAIDAGVNVGLTKDFLLNSINNIPDIGAYESSTKSTTSAATTTYYNTAVSATATKNSCGTGYTGSTVTYTVAAKKYSSTISQADADSKASADLASNKQAYANTNGTCTQVITATPTTTTKTTAPATATTAITTIYYSTSMSVSATKNSCGSGYEGSTVTYTVPANKYTSTISQADANSQAQADLNANAQIYANNNGTCTLTKTSKKNSYWWWRS